MKKLKFGTYFLGFLAILLLTQCKDDEAIIDTVPDSCCSTPYLQVTFENKNYYIPNIITGNYDGVNDIFMIHGGDLVNTPWELPINSFIVKDSSGVILHEAYDFSANDPDYAWDGTNSSGTPMRGVYPYEIVFKGLTGGDLMRSGWVCNLPRHPITCINNFLDCGFSTYNDGGVYSPNFPSFEDCTD